MNELRILDLDGSLVGQRKLLEIPDSRWVDARDWGPRIRLACRFRTYRDFDRWLEQTPAGEPGGLTLYGSGDFHHVTLALLRRLTTPFNLLVLDKHPDWMRGVPFLHCGTWLREALRLPTLLRVFHCGGDTDFDNVYRYLAPWSEIVRDRIVVFPARRRFARGRWRLVPSRPLNDEHQPLIDALQTGLTPFLIELKRHPLYVSIDKDVLTEDQAAVNWDSGLLSLAEAIIVLRVFLSACSCHLAGADLLGDWSPIRLGTPINRLCDILDHPSPQYDPSLAAIRNAAANSAFLSVLREAAW